MKLCINAAQVSLEWLIQTFNVSPTLIVRTLSGAELGRTTLPAAVWGALSGVTYPAQGLPYTITPIANGTPASAVLIMDIEGTLFRAEMSVSDTLGAGEVGVSSMVWAVGTDVTVTRFDVKQAGYKAALDEITLEEVASFVFDAALHQGALPWDMSGTAPTTLDLAAATKGQFAGETCLRMRGPANAYNVFRWISGPPIPLGATIDYVIEIAGYRASGSSSTSLIAGLTSRAHAESTHDSRAGLWRLFDFSSSDTTSQISNALVDNGLGDSPVSMEAGLSCARVRIEPHATTPDRYDIYAKVWNRYTDGEPEQWQAEHLDAALPHADGDPFKIMTRYNTAMAELRYLALTLDGSPAPVRS